MNNKIFLNFVVTLQGSPQWIQIDFPKAVIIKELSLQFQGGFAGKDCWIEVKKNGNMEKSISIHPEDNNSLQISFNNFYLLYFSLYYLELNYLF